MPHFSYSLDARLKTAIDTIFSLVHWIFSLSIFISLFCLKPHILFSQMYLMAISALYLSHGRVRANTCIYISIILATDIMHTVKLSLIFCLNLYFLYCYYFVVVMRFWDYLLNAYFFVTNSLFKKTYNYKLLVWVFG
jgi:hypothetical protein